MCPEDKLYLTEDTSSNNLVFLEVLFWLFFIGWLLSGLSGKSKQFLKNALEL